MARNCDAIGSDLAPLARLPRRAERRSNRPDSPQILTTIHHQNFFASKGSVCWSLLVSEHSVFASWIAVSTPRITRCRGVARCSSVHRLPAARLLSSCRVTAVTALRYAKSCSLTT